MLDVIEASNYAQKRAKIGTISFNLEFSWRIVFETSNGLFSTQGFSSSPSEFACEKRSDPILALKRPNGCTFTENTVSQLCAKIELQFVFLVLLRRHFYH